MTFEVTARGKFGYLELRQDLAAYLFEQGYHASVFIKDDLVTLSSLRPCGQHEMTAADYSALRYVAHEWFRTQGMNATFLR